MAAPTLSTPFQPYVYQSPQAVVTPFQILGGEAQIVQFLLKPGERVHAEPGAMCYMSGNMTSNTTLTGGSFWRWLSGESFFCNMFVNSGPGDGYIGFATPTLAKVLPVDLAMYGGDIICQRDAYLCSINDVTVTAELTRRARVGFFGHDGFFLQRLSGQGLAFISASGSIVQKNLGVRETVVVDAACVLAMTRSVDFDIKYVGSIKRAIFGGEGMFYAHLTGPGVVFLQSLPFNRLAAKVTRAGTMPRGMEANGVVGPVLFYILAAVFIMVWVSVFVYLEFGQGQLQWQNLI